MKIEFGEIESIANLKQGEKHILIIPGFIRIKYGDVAMDAKAYQLYIKHSQECDDYIQTVHSACREFADQRGLKLYLSHNPFADIIVELTGFSFSKLARYWLTTLSEDEDEDVVFINRCNSDKSEQNTIRTIAKKLGVPISIERGVSTWNVYRDGTIEKPKHKEKTNGDVRVMGAIDAWIATLDHDVPTPPPEELTKVCTDSYFRTVLNKSPHTITYRRGLVTKHSYLVRYRKNQYEVFAHGQLLGRSKEHDSSLFNLWLKPYGYTYVEK